MTRKVRGERVSQTPQRFGGELVHVTLAFGMERLRREELALLQARHVGRRMRGFAALGREEESIAYDPGDGETLEGSEVAVREIATGEGIGDGVVGGVRGGQTGCVHRLEGEEDAGQFDVGVAAVRGEFGGGWLVVRARWIRRGVHARHGSFFAFAAADGKPDSL